MQGGFFQASFFFFPVYEEYEWNLNLCFFHLPGQALMLFSIPP